MTAYNDMTQSIAGLRVGIGDAETVDTPVAAETLEFGQPVFGYKGEDTAYGFYKDVAIGVYAADFVASNSIAFSVNGTAITPVVYATSHAATVAALVNAINGLDGVEAVLDPSDTNSRTVLVRVKGATAAVTSTVTLGSAQAGFSATYSSGQVFLGITQFIQTYPGAYAAEDLVNVVRIGSIYARSETGPVKNGDGYVNDNGNVDNAGTAIATVRFGSDESDTSGLVVCQVLGKTDMAYADSF